MYTFVKNLWTEKKKNKTGKTLKYQILQTLQLQVKIKFSDKDFKRLSKVQINQMMAAFQGP